METDLQHVHAERSRLNIANITRGQLNRTRAAGLLGGTPTTTSTYRKCARFLHQCDGSVRKKSDFLTRYTTFTVKTVTKSFSLVHKR